MTKTDLINAVAAKTGLSKKDSDKAVAAFVEAVTESLAKGEKVALLGFGTFDVKTRAARKGINPRTKREESEIFAPVGRNGNKPHCLYCPINRVPHESFMVVGDEKLKNLATSRNPLDFVLAYQGFWQLIRCFYQRIVTGHIVITSVKIAVEYKTDITYLFVLFKRVFDNLSGFTHPKNQNISS